ncbi:MAG: tRNA (N(6)-L-threonylcarbamoyladenosine(37)-C(2))-methylthiotransferase [Euryarchaeota archaeon]|nr:tRNA (N(6)-L-threonylcarbamoyladenosine(37)-C(2))-methylthiotransferase [Euryarchaeota archaeon]
MKLYYEAYGCALNRGETEVAIGKVKSIRIIRNLRDAQLLLISTCVVIEYTELKMRKRIAALNALKKPLIITGCYVSAFPQETEGGGARIKYISPGNSDELAAAIRGFAVEKKGERTKGANRLLAPPMKNAVGIVPISSGCLGSCTYCITRLARGGLASRPIEAITRDIKALAARGACEIDLASQDSAIFGKDIGSSLPSLMSKTSSIEGDFVVRIGMMNPEGVLPILGDIISAYKDDKMFKFLHLPVQSGSDRVLKAMGRRYSVGNALTIVAEFRKAFPGITISTDVIVGFPGETGRDHALTIKALEKMSPDIVNVTRFSARPGTPAAAMPGAVHGRIAKARSRELTALRLRLGKERNERYIGEIVRCIATERGKRGTTVARTVEYKPVILPGRVRLGTWHSVEIVSATAVDLRAKMAKRRV